MKNAPPPRPLLIFDGDCSFCRRWIARWRNLTGDAIDYEPAQTAADQIPSISRQEFGRSVFLVEPNGDITRAAEAVFRSLALAGQKRCLYWLYRRVPPFRWASEAAYRLIATSRNVIDPIDRLIIGTETSPATYDLTRALFLRLIGFVYLIAFWSLFVQIDGLIGSNGILPARGFLENIRGAVGPSVYWRAPTLMWLNSSDAFLHALCIGGIVCSSLLILGVAPMAMTMLLWAGYLSLSVVGQDFLSFQWDALLLEAGFLAILWSPILWVTTKTPPSRVVLFLLRWLLFRLMFLSALTKWLWRDECWRDMSALRYHFETQPLPTWTSWYAHFSSPWMLTLGCLAMFVIEWIIPFLYFGPRRVRMFAFWMTVLLQIMIMATGNYGFFNVLTIVLSLTLLDDAALSRAFHLTLPPRKTGRPMLRPLIVWPVSIVLFIVTLMQFIDTRPDRLRPWPAPLSTVHEYVLPFRSTNSYGLFRVMTRERPELVVEGSDDGQNWKPYTFRYKMQDEKRRPRFCAGHMPRLDWQMWFAALSPEPPGWFVNFAARLLEGRKEVLVLLAGNPFPNSPPKYVRAVLYDYRFSKPGSKTWWTGQPVRIYLPPIWLQHRKAVDDGFRL